MKQLTPKGYSLYLLKLRDRSVGEISNKLKDKGFSQEDISLTVEFLLEHSFLDDHRFARNFVRQRLLSRKQGTRLLRQKLKEKQIKDDIIEEALAEIDSKSEFSSACDLAQKWLSSHKNVPEEMRWNKIGSFLTRRGYDYDQVKKVLSEILNKNIY